MTRMKLLLKNARIYDGTGSAAFPGDVLTEDDRILRVGGCIDEPADEVIDLEGASLAPGFIDAHSHNDWFLLQEDPLPWFEPFIRQGITTFVTGNCGISTIGFDRDTPHRALMGAGLFGFPEGKDSGGSLDSFFAQVDGHMPCNVAVLAGHCTSRASVSGSVNRPLTGEEESRMLALMEDALRQGAAGISLGLMYDPGLYAQSPELKKVAALCAKYGRPLTVHPRANSAVSMSYPELLGRSHLLRAVDELKEIALETKCKLHYSHAIFVGRRSFGNKDEFVAIMNELRAQGVDAMFDIYDELLGVSVITVILPAWYQAMTQAERKKPLNRLKLAVLVHASSLLLGFGFKDIQVAYIGPGYEQYEGKTVHDIALEEGMSDLNAYLMLCEKSSFTGRVNMGPYTTPEIIAEFEHNEHCLYMTDAWVEAHGVQNPAIYDCFPKFLRDALRGTGDTLPATIRRMTGATADRFQLPDRGYIRPGCHADLTVFDEAELASATPDQEKSFGIRRVFINGRQVLNADAVDRAALKTTGQAIRVK